MSKEIREQINKIRSKQEEMKENETFTMYHGTSVEGEKLLLKYGWKPYQVLRGSQQGNPAYLYVSSTPEGAEWYAAEKGNGGSVIMIKNIPKSFLGVDPEDHIYTNLDTELEHNTQFTIRNPLNPDHFSRYDGGFKIVRGDDFDDYYNP